MKEAYNILLPLKDNDVRTRTVVMFTDGKPTHYGMTGEDFGGESDSGFSNIIASGCIRYAYNIKNEIGAPVFSVGLFANADKTDQIKTYMEYTSSDHTDKQAMPASTTDYIPFNTPNGDYCFIVSDNLPLDEIFSKIASQSGGSKTALSAASSNVDVVSSSFVLPSEVNADNVGDKIKIFIAKVNNDSTMAYNGDLRFYEERIKGQLGGDVNWTYQELDATGAIKPGVAPKLADAGISISLATVNGQPAIKVTGFDYSSCFCGPIYQSGWNPEGQSDADNLAHVDHYQGYKIIIMIPIKANQEAVGGPNVDTNAPGSGIYIKDGEQSALVPYVSPTVSLPYNFFITKKGLRPGESAKFKLERASLNPYYNDKGELPKGWSATSIPEESWMYVSTVFVTQPENASPSNNPIVKVRGLPSTSDTNGDYIYRISEEVWSWSYHRDAPQYTDKSKVDNPFTFENKKKEGIDQKVRHAESKATNVFNGSSTNNVVYDDSKGNVR